MAFDFERELERLRPAMQAHAREKLGVYGLESGAEDVVQDALLYAWQHKPSFDARSGTSGLKAWVRTMVDYRASNLARLQKREKWLERPIYRDADDERDPLDLIPDFTDVEAEALDNLERQQDRARLHNLINRAGLSECERAVLETRLSTDAPYSEVGAALGMSEGAARIAYFRAVAKLRAAVEEQF